jgi:hypothetical protein
MFRVQSSARLPYFSHTRLAQWIRHDTTDVGMGVRFPHRVYFYRMNVVTLKTNTDVGVRFLYRKISASMRFLKNVVALFHCGILLEKVNGFGHFSPQYILVPLFFRWRVVQLARMLWFCRMKLIKYHFTCVSVVYEV